LAKIQSRVPELCIFESISNFCRSLRHRGDFGLSQASRGMLSSAKASNHQKGTGYKRYNLYETESLSPSGMPLFFQLLWPSGGLHPNHPMPQPTYSISRASCDSINRRHPSHLMSVVGHVINGYHKQVAHSLTLKYIV
jgi:hypothetical protein